MNFKKIFKIILLIIIIILIVVIINTTRKFIILSKYLEKNNEYSIITNFYIKQEDSENAIIETWRKDDLFLYKHQKDNDIKMICIAKDCNWIIVEGTDENNNIVKNAIKIPKDDGITKPLTLDNKSLCPNTLWQKIYIALSSRITTETINNNECYKLFMLDDFQIYINKSDYLVEKEINGTNSTTLLEYKINEVIDEDVALPDLTDFNIKE